MIMQETGVHKSSTATPTYGSGKSHFQALSNSWFAKTGLAVPALIGTAPSVQGSGL
jgi:hypothetical protein